MDSLLKRAAVTVLAVMCVAFDSLSSVLSMAGDGLFAALIAATLWMPGKKEGE